MEKLPQHWHTPWAPLRLAHPSYQLRWAWSGRGGGCSSLPGLPSSCLPEHSAENQSSVPTGETETGRQEGAWNLRNCSGAPCILSLPAGPERLSWGVAGRALLPGPWMGRSCSTQGFCWGSWLRSWGHHKRGGGRVSAPVKGLSLPSLTSVRTSCIWGPYPRGSQHASLACDLLLDCGWPLEEWSRSCLEPSVPVAVKARELGGSGARLTIPKGPGHSPSPFSLEPGVGWWG